MPTPIPEWDLARRLLKYVGFKQVNGEAVTIRETMRTMGIGRERIEKIMQEKEIVYQIIPSEEKPSEDRLAIQFAPPNLMADAGLSTADLAKSFIESTTGNFSSRKVRQRRLTKKQKEAQKINSFWGHT